MALTPNAISITRVIWGGTLIPPGGDATWIDVTLPERVAAQVTASGSVVRSALPDKTGTLDMNFYKEEAGHRVVADKYAPLKADPTGVLNAAGLPMQITLSNGTILTCNAAVLQEPNVTGARETQLVTWRFHLDNVATILAVSVSPVGV